MATSSTQPKIPINFPAHKRPHEEEEEEEEKEEVDES
jgi:hypothetical protein